MAYRVKVEPPIDEVEKGVWFEFNNLCDAVEFMSTCMECGDVGVSAYIYERNKEEE